MTPSLDATLSLVMTSLPTAPRQPDAAKRSTEPTTFGMSKLGKLLSIRDSAEFRAKVIGLDESDPLPRRLSKSAEAWIKAAATNRRDNGTWMVVCGPTGVGKSHALRASRDFMVNHAVDLYGEFWTCPPSVIHCAWSRIIDLDDEEWDNWLYDLRRSHVVILDDVGSEVDRFKSGAPAERLRITFETCERKFLLISTNLRPDRWVEAFDERVKSRMMRAVTLDMTGATDWRPRKKTNITQD